MLDVCVWIPLETPRASTTRAETNGSGATASSRVASSKDAKKIGRVHQLWICLVNKVELLVFNMSEKGERIFPYLRVKVENPLHANVDDELSTDANLKFKQGYYSAKKTGKKARKGKDRLIRPQSCRLGHILMALLRHAGILAQLKKVWLDQF